MVREWSRLEGLAVLVPAGLLVRLDGAHWWAGPEDGLRIKVFDGVWRFAFGDAALSALAETVGVR